MPYTPDPTNTSEPTDARTGITAPAEFRALKSYIQSELNTKANSADVPLKEETLTPALIGLLDTAVTQGILTHLAATYTNTQAMNNLIATVKDVLYPVGTLYVNVADLPNPATYLGFGTWVPYPSQPGGWERTA